MDTYRALAHELRTAIFSVTAAKAVEAGTAINELVQQLEHWKANWDHEALESESLRQQLAAALAACKVKDEALKLWKIASDNAEESELDEMACYCVPMPLFCDADEAMEEALAATDLGGLILCHAEPVAWQFVDDEKLNYTALNINPPTQEPVEYLKKWNRPEWEPLYRAWEQKP